MPSDQPLPNKCGAKLRRHPGMFCTQPKMPNGRCKMHGGKALKGPASGSYKTGRYSTYALALPERYRDTFFRALDAKKAIELTEQIALVEAREVELVARLTPETSTALWHRARAALDELREAYGMVDSDPKKALIAAASFDALVAAVEQGVSNESTWALLLDTLEARRKLVDTERRRVEALGAHLTPEQAIQFAAQIIGIVRDETNDRKLLDAIARRVEKLLPSGDVIDVTPQSKESAEP